MVAEGRLMWKGQGCLSVPCSTCGMNYVQRCTACKKPYDEDGGEFVTKCDAHGWKMKFETAKACSTSL